MDYPLKLFRYRPLNDKLLEREIETLQKSYLFSASFSAMNDPMEAFYETGGQSDFLIDEILRKGGKSASDIYTEINEMTNKFGLVSFSSTHNNLPMWAYYANNFSGMCLEFNTNDISIGDFQNEPLREITYAEEPLPPILIGDFYQGNVDSVIIDRLTRKRFEWAHEKEWRFITGKTGAKNYLDDALCKVYLGPCIDKIHSAKIHEVLSNRPVEILQGEIKGFNLFFRTTKSKTPYDQCDKVGSQQFDRSEDLYAEKELRDFLTVPFENLLDECRRTALRPNMERFGGIDIAGRDRRSIYFWTIYKLRNGQEISHKRYFNQHFDLIE